MRICVRQCKIYRLFLLINKISIFILTQRLRWYGGDLEKFRASFPTLFLLRSKNSFNFEAGKTVLPNMWFKHFKSVKGYNRRNLNFVCMWYSCVLVQVCASVHEWVYMCICRVQRTISGYSSLCLIYLVFYRWVLSFSSKPQRSACLFLPRLGWHVWHHVRFCFICGFGTKSRFFSLSSKHFTGNITWDQGCSF